MEKEELWPKLEAQGEDKVRENLAANRYGEAKIGLVREWLRHKEASYSAAAAARAEAREDESLSISKQALRNSEEANSTAKKALSEQRKDRIIATSAMVLSVATAIIVAVIQFIGQRP